MKDQQIVLRVLSYNIHKGFSTGNRKFVLKSIRHAIQSTNADIVFLQEVLGEHQGHAASIEEWPAESQFEFLAGEIWPHHAYGRNRVHLLGHHGNAVLSRFPIVRWENTDISNTRFERRGILHAVIDVPGIAKEVHCLCVHLGLSQRSRRGQLQELVRIINNNVGAENPLLLAGDFNDWSRRASKQLADHLRGVEVFKHFLGKHARTFPSWMPLLQLDRVYSRGFDIVSAEVMKGEAWKKLSDHIALFAELTVSE